MANVSPIQTSFNVGEISPLMRGRVDFKKLPAACDLIENGIPQITGPVMKRPGTRFVKPIKTQTEKARLIPFEYSAVDAYALEFGNKTLRFFTRGGQVLDDEDEPYEIEAPYSSDELSELSFAQSADVIYLVHPNHAPMKLARYAPTDWRLDEVEFTRPPFNDLNITSTTIATSGTTGTVTVTASSAIFTAEDVGKSISKAVIPASGYSVWVANQAITSGMYRQYQGRVYQADNTGTTGTNPPLHIVGIESDGGVAWRYVSDGTGYMVITAYTSPTQVTAEVKQDLPNTTATTRWAWGAWSDDYGWPRTVTFYEDRLWFGGNKAKPQTIWASVTGDYENFTYGTNDDDGLNYTINTQDLNTITWLSPGKVLAIGTTSGEFTISGNQISDPITPTSVRIIPQTTYGCAGTVRPLRVASAILFVQRAGRKIREYAYNFETDAYVAPNLNSLADHITTTGVIDLAYQQEPSQVVWAPRADGILAGLTYERAEDVVGWNRQTIAGGREDNHGVVESVVCLPHWDGDQDVTWLIVRRTIDGQVTRYIEYIEKYRKGVDAFFMDSGLTYSGAPTTTIGGLDHLEGEEVAVLTDGAVHPKRTVVDGSITLQHSASTVVVGLSYVMRVRLLPFEAGSQNGATRGKLQRIHKTTLMLDSTGPGLWYGSPAKGREQEWLDEMQMRDPYMRMDEPVPLFTGTTDPVSWPSNTNREQQMQFEHRLPLPCTIVAVMPQLETYDGG